MKKFLLSIFCCLMAFVALQAQSYVKVTSAPTDWSGDYLIVYETGNVAFNGGLTTLDATSNTISVEISNGKIDATDATNAAKFTIDENGYIKSVSGYYIGQTSDANGLKSNKTTTYKNTLTLNSSDGSVNVVSGGAYLRYNATSGQTRFRYYKSGSYTNQKAIFLYKYTEATSGGGDTDDPVVESVATPVISPESCNFNEGKSVEVAITAEEGATIYYTIDGSEPSADNGEEYVDPFEITETTTVKAIAVKDGCNDSEIVEATYTMIAEGEVVDVLTRETTGITGTNYKEWTEITVASSAVYAGQSAGGNDAIQLRSNNSNSGIITTTSGGKAKKIVVKWQSATASGRILQVYGKNSAYAAVTELYDTSTQGTKLGEIKCGTSTELEIDGDYEYIGLRSSSGAMYLTSIEITWDAATDKEEGFTLSVGEAGWATLYLPIAVVIPTNVKCYAVENVEDGYALLTQIKGVLPALTAVLVEAPANNYALEVADEANEYNGVNKLCGTLMNQYVNEEAYVLSAPEGKVGLYKAAMAGGVFLNNANKAYLPVSAIPASAQGAANFSFNFDWNGTTGIENIEAAEENAAFKGIYDLTGRKINKIAVTGIYIIDGKKVLVVK